MPILTSFVLAGFAAYIGAWLLGRIEGNFALLLFIATVLASVVRGRRPTLEERSHETS